jgi:hypothetical protein
MVRFATIETEEIEEESGERARVPNITRVAAVLNVFSRSLRMRVDLSSQKPKRGKTPEMFLSPTCAAQPAEAV